MVTEMIDRHWLVADRALYGGEDLGDALLLGDVVQRREKLGHEVVSW